MVHNNFKFIGNNFFAIQTRQDRGWGQRLRWVHVKSGKTNHLIFPETHKIELKNLAMGAKCNFVGLEEDAYNKMEGIVQV